MPVQFLEYVGFSVLPLHFVVEFDYRIIHGEYRSCEKMLKSYYSHILPHYPIEKSVCLLKIDYEP
jgi:hypothetical protein